MIPQTNLGTFLGDFTTGGLRLLGVVPQDASEAAQVRAMHLLVHEALLPNAQDFWTFQLGRLDETGGFRLCAQEISFQKGLKNNSQTIVPFLDPVLYSRGDLVAAKLVTYGAPPILSGLSVVLEWGILSSRHGPARN